MRTEKGRFSPIDRVMTMLRTPRRRPRWQVLTALVLCAAVAIYLCTQVLDLHLQPYLMQGPYHVTYITRGAPVPRTEGAVKVMPKPELDDQLAPYLQRHVIDLNQAFHSLSDSMWPLGKMLFMQHMEVENWPILSWFYAESTKVELAHARTMMRPWHVTRSADVQLGKFADLVLGTDILKKKVYPSGQRQDSCAGCFKYSAKQFITPKVSCEPPEQVELYAVVTTTAKDVSARDSVRKTWGTLAKLSGSGFKLVFLLGGGMAPALQEQLHQEAAIHGDLLQDDYKDDYYNLTYKVLSGYHWVMKSCPQAKFLMRGADDIIVNVPGVMQLLQKYRHTETFQKYQVGNCFPGYVPYRWPDFKGYIATVEYNKNIFPPYALGTLFLTSNNLTNEILKASPNVPFFSIEDAYFGLLLEQMGRGCHHVEGLMLTSDRFKIPLGRPYLSLHTFAAKQILNYYDRFMQESNAFLAKGITF